MHSLFEEFDELYGGVSVCNTHTYHILVAWGPERSVRVNFNEQPAVELGVVAVVYFCRESPPFMCTSLLYLTRDGLISRDAMTSFTDAFREVEMLATTE